MQKNNIRGPFLTVPLVAFSILFLAAAGAAQGSIMQTAAVSEGSSIEFSSWRVSSGGLLTQSSLAVGARSTTSLASNVAYTLNTTAITSSSQSSYTFRPNRYELAAVDYSYHAAAQRHSGPGNRHHHHGSSPSGSPTTPVVSAVPDGGSSLILFLIT